MSLKHTFNKSKHLALLLILSLLLTTFSACDSTLRSIGISSPTTAPYDHTPALLELAIGDSLGAYNLLEREWSADYEGDIFLFEHTLSKGKVAYIAANDQNKWFTAVFKTPTYDHSGVNHILEHTVLEGSEKFQVKSPFTELSKGSVNTFMNAFTGSDLTSYVFASENDKDFDNLFHVYLDAAFAPLVRESSNLLMQEGWRYESHNTSYRFNGVVLNEMRGVLTDRYNWIYTQIPQSLYPDTHYAYDFGGDPLHIVDLTHKQLTDTYNAFYHPTNALLIFYGNLDLKEKLDYIDTHYYRDFYEKRPVKSETITVSSSLQSPFGQVRSQKIDYPAHYGATKESDSMLTFNRSINNLSFEDQIGLELLMALFLDTQDPSVSGYLDTSYRQPMWHLLKENASHGGMDDFVHMVERQLRTWSENGIDSDSIAWVTQHYALDFRLERTKANRGESALLALERGFVTHDNPLYAINALSALATIQDKIQNGNYFGDLIDRTLLNTQQTNTALITFTPNPDLAQQRDEALSTKLKNRLTNMSAEDIQAIEKSLATYQAYQSKPIDPVALDILPKLTLADLQQNEAPYTQKQEKIGITPYFIDTVNSHGLTAIKLYFSLEGLTKESFSYLPLLKHGISLQDKELRHYTGGLETELLFLQDDGNAHHAKPYLTISTYFLNENLDIVLPLLLESLQNYYLDEDTLMTALSLSLQEAESILYSDNETLAIQHVSAATTAAGALSFLAIDEGYETLKDLETHWDEKFQVLGQTITVLTDTLLTNRRLTLSVTTDAKGKKGLKQKMSKFLGNLPLGAPPQVTAASWLPQLPNRNALHIDKLATNTDVSHVEIGFHLSALNHPLKGSDIILMQYLSDTYMYQKARLEGGAYGGYAGIAYDNTVYFSGTSVPNYERFLEVVIDLPKNLDLMTIPQSEIDRTILSTVGRMYLSGDTMSGSDYGVMDFLMPSSVNWDKLMRQMLETKAEDLPEFRNMLAQGLDKAYCLIIGPMTPED